jgi:site-specific recombinase
MRLVEKNVIFPSVTRTVKVSIKRAKRLLDIARQRGEQAGRMTVLYMEFAVESSDEAMRGYYRRKSARQVSRKMRYERFADRLHRVLEGN